MNRVTSLPLLAVVAVLALVLGSVGTAVAGPALTKGKVKKIAAKVIQKQAPSLSVANATNATNATNLGGKPATAYTATAYLFRLPALAPAPARTFTFGGLPAGSYSFSFSVIAQVPSGAQLTCYLRAVPPSSVAEAMSYGEPSGPFSTAQGSGTIVVGTAAPALQCSSTGNMEVNPDDGAISNITFTPLDSVQTATATGARGGAGPRGGSLD